MPWQVNDAPVANASKGVVLAKATKQRIKSKKTLRTTFPGKGPAARQPFITKGGF